MASTGVSSSRSFWLFWGDSLWDLSSGPLDGQHSGPSCLHPSLVGHESLWGVNPNLSFLVWWVCDQLSHKHLSHEWVVSSCSWYFFLNAFMRWLRLAMEACVSACLSSMFLIDSAKLSTTLLTLDANSSQVSLSSNLLVRQQHIEGDCEWSSLSFRLKRWDVLSHSLGGSCLDPPWTVLLGTALPLPLSGGMVSYSSSTSLVLGDSCALVFDPPPAGVGVVVALWGLLKVFLPKACAQWSLCRWSLAQLFKATAIGSVTRGKLDKYEKECDIWMWLSRLTVTVIVTCFLYWTGRIAEF